MSKAQQTRMAILEKAFELIYINGYQATSIDDIIATTKVTKGAFFHHFSNKEEMGLAVITEVMSPGMYQAFVLPLENSDKPVTDLYRMMKDLLLDNPHMQVKYGCPAGNLVQEMSPLNKKFNAALLVLVNQFHQAIEQCITNGKKKGNIRKNINGKQVAIMVMSGYWGVRSLGKLYNATGCYKTYLKELKNYLKTLQ